MSATLSDREVAYLLAVTDLARRGDVGQLEDAVEAGISVDLTTSTGDTLLILATYHGHYDTVALLLDRGADSNRVNDHGQTALGAAVFRQRSDIVNALLAHGADPRAGARPAIDIAQFFGLDEMAWLLEGAEGSGIANGRSMTVDFSDRDGNR